jgi:hypothetical protein
VDYASGTYIAAQIFAFASMLVSLWSQQCRTRTMLLVMFIIANLLNAVHFQLLSAMTGVAMALIGAVRFGVSIVSTGKHWLAFFLIVNTIATYMVFEGWLLSGTSYLAATFIILSTFVRSDHWMRVSIILGAFGWLAYGALIGSIVAIISGMAFFISSCVGWYRHVYRSPVTVLPVLVE